MDLIRRCVNKDGSFTYTLAETCPTGQPSTVARPARFSQDDKYAAYRRQAKFDAAR